MTPSERERRILPADYESFWEQRYNEQHRTLHSCEDALTEARERAERAEAAARDFAKALKAADHALGWIAPWGLPPSERERRSEGIIAIHDALARHSSFSGEEGTER